ncbi:GntR family transcriptional regulator [Streptomyces sp. NPDC046465]|uniref:GntR family transcriptional regulator n=1 Tax=Streptomyces sp. NPDC046465 TaxID=3155810 RepID=UPI0033E06248
MTERTALYRYFDADGVLLYVGISNNPDFRSRAHLYERRPDSWPKRAVRRVDEWLPTRPLALRAEEEAVKTEKPLYNRKHNYDDVEFDPTSWTPVTARLKVVPVAELMRCEILGGAWPVGYRIPSLRTLGTAAGVSMRIASKAAGLLQREGLLRFESGHGLFVAPHPQCLRRAA